MTQFALRCWAKGEDYPSLLAFVTMGPAEAADWLARVERFRAAKATEPGLYQHEFWSGAVWAVEVYGDRFTGGEQERLENLLDDGLDVRALPEPFPLDDDAVVRTECMTALVAEDGVRWEWYLKHQSVEYETARLTVELLQEVK